MLCLSRDVRERVPTGGGRMVRVEKNLREIVGLKTTVSGRGDHTRNVGYKAGGISFDYETKTFKCDHGKAVGRRDGRGGGQAFWIFSVTAGLELA